MKAEKNKLYTEVEEKVTVKKIYTLEEVKTTILSEKPKGLKIIPYSQTKLCILIGDMDADKISYRWESATDMNFKSVSWPDFYKLIKGYIIDIEF